jgi:hypothetical protein
MYFATYLLRRGELGLDLGQYLGVRRDAPLSQIDVCGVRVFANQLIQASCRVLGF